MAFWKSPDTGSVNALTWTAEMNSSRSNRPRHKLNRAHESVAARKHNDLGPMLRCEHRSEWLVATQQRIADEACRGHLNEAPNEPVVTVPTSANGLCWRDALNHFRDESPQEHPSQQSICTAKSKESEWAFCGTL